MIEALNRVRQETSNYGVVDHLAPELDGLILLEQIKELKLKVPVLVISDRYDVKPYLAAMNLGALDYLGKPIDYARASKKNREFTGVIFIQGLAEYNVVLDED
ncbi:MAG: response regulator [Terriglobia bacterium]